MKILAIDVGDASKQRWIFMGNNRMDNGAMALPSMFALFSIGALGLVCLNGQLFGQSNSASTPNLAASRSPEIIPVGVTATVSIHQIGGRK